MCLIEGYRLGCAPPTLSSPSAAPAGGVSDSFVGGGVACATGGGPASGGCAKRFLPATTTKCRVCGDTELLVVHHRRPRQAYQALSSITGIEVMGQEVLHRWGAFVGIKGGREGGLIGESVWRPGGSERHKVFPQARSAYYKQLFL